MTRTPPVLLLVLLSPVVAELSIGDLPFSARGLVAFLFVLPIYGAGALLVREVVRRRSATGWPAIALLGVAYGIVEEGLALQSLFSPTMYDGLGPAWGGRVLGVNGVYLVVQLLNHAVWSVLVPIALTDLAFPRRRSGPLLGRVGLAVTAVVFCLGVALTAAGRGARDPDYSTPPALLLAAGVAVVALVVTALLVSRRPVRGTAAGQAPRPIVAFGLGLAGGFGALAVLVWPAHAHAAVLHGPFVEVPILGSLAIVAAAAVLVRRWSAANGWNDVHLLALTSGALLGHSLAWGPVQARTTAARVGVAVLFAVTVALLGLLARAVGRRVDGGFVRHLPVAVGTARRAP